jgi:outer membrane protein OmpA-like peptidoglycan-associated protein
MGTMGRFTRFLLPLVLLLGAAGLFLLWNAARDDDDGSTAAGTATTVDGDAAATTTTADGDAADEGPSAEGDAETGGSAEAGSSTTTTAGGGTTTTTAGGAGGLDLPEADPSADPVEPIGVYSDGRLTLSGSVPDEEVAAAYLEKVGGVIGADNVTMQMSVDPRVSGETLTVDVAEQFRFPTGSASYDPQFEALLNLGVAALQLLPESTLVVTGHTDDVGADDVNQALSLARAQVVVDFMVRGGIPPERIIARGAGETQPIADNTTAEGRQANRRIEATLEGIRPA